MGKKKIALFYDESTESGKQILDFLAPFARRKSDIVGELILLWIAEHGTNVPVQWLDRTRGELGTVKPYFPQGASVAIVEEEKQGFSGSESDGAEDFREAMETSKERKEAAEQKAPGEAAHDVSLIRAGLASFM